VCRLMGSYYGARMRHLGTLIAAVIIAPLAWILLAFGQDRSAQAFANVQGDAFDKGDFLRPALCLAAAGLLFGLIATLRFSPLGAVLTGIVYADSYLALLVNPKRLLDVFPGKISVAGRSADLTTPLRTGTALLLGALLLVGVASIGRWRRWPAREAPETALPDESPVPMPMRDSPLAGANPLHLGMPAWTTGPDPTRGTGPDLARGTGPAPARGTGPAPARGTGPAPSNISNWVASLRGDSDRPPPVTGPPRGPFG
jgi:hypothetical protein